MHRRQSKYERMRILSQEGFAFALLLIAGQAFAWGPFTHAYIAMQVTPNAPPQMVFGAMAADLNDFNGFDEKLGGKVKHFTHFEAARLAPSPFRQGMLTHNSDWGADSYAHAYFHVPTDKLYPLRIFEQLNRELDISMNDAEDMVELLMDFVVCRDMGPGFVRAMVEAASSVGPEEEQALVSAFAGPLAHEMPGLGQAEAEQWLRIMFESDQEALKQTAELTLQVGDSLLDGAPSLLTIAFDMDIAKARRCVQRVVELCADWRVHLDSIAGEVAARMKTEEAKEKTAMP